MKKLSLNIVLISLLSTASFKANSQTLFKVANKISVTGGLGTSFYNGDLVGDLWNIDLKILHFAWRLGLL